MRLFIIYFMLSPNISEAELSQYETALEGVGADIMPLKYLKKWK